MCATTSPIYVSVQGSVAKSVEDAGYFIGWIDRLKGAATANRDWNSEAEKTAVLKTLDEARQVYVRLQKQG